MKRISLLASAFLFSVGFVACTDYQGDYESAWEAYADPDESGSKVPSTSVPSGMEQDNSYCKNASGEFVDIGKKDPATGCTCLADLSWKCPETSKTCTDAKGSSYNVGAIDPTYGSFCMNDGSWGNCVSCKDDKGKSYTVGQVTLGCTCTINGSWNCPSDVIDDLEDGDMTCNSGGRWSAYSDYENGGSTTFSNKISEGVFVVPFSGSSLNGTKFVAGLSDIKLNAGSYKYDPFAGLTLALRADEAPYDLSSCSQFVYDYSGANHQFRVMMYGDYNGEKSEFDYHGFSVTGIAGWTTVAIPMSSLKQKGWGSKVALNASMIGRIGWEIQGTAKYNYLFIDNIRCVGADIK